MGGCTYQCLNMCPFRKVSHVVEYHKIELLCRNIVENTRTYSTILNPQHIYNGTWLILSCYEGCVGGVGGLVADCPT